MSAPSVGCQDEVYLVVNLPIKGISGPLHLRTHTHTHTRARERGVGGMRGIIRPTFPPVLACEEAIIIIITINLTQKANRQSAGFLRYRVINDTARLTISGEFIFFTNSGLRRLQF